MNEGTTILLTGATGYVGGRLLDRLEQLDLPVRCLSRHPEKLKDAVAPSTEVVEGDLLKPESLESALRGVETAYYFVHSMGATGDFAEEDRWAATNFVAAADKCGVRRIVYLGGLGEESEELSKHLRSRHETGEILRSAKAQVIELRASIVIGAGSLSFELIRALVERLPVMICPKWVGVKAQPIATDDLLSYLVECLSLPETESRVFEIGGPDQVSYGEIMKEYARQRHLRRLMISVPLLTPYLSSLWLSLVTPVYARVGRKLVESLRNPTLVKNNDAKTAFAVVPKGLTDAVSQSLAREDEAFEEMRWSEVLKSGKQKKSWGGVRLGSRIVSSRTRIATTSRARVFEVIQTIGGENGWYFGNWLWQVRGLLDRIVGGIGFRRGRRDPLAIEVGDPIDFWRVQQFEPGRRLRLRAEMRLPGRAWLEFDVEDQTPDGGSATVRQTAVFDPRGLLGLVYWYALYPVHQFVFAGMLRNLVKRASEKPSTSPKVDSQ